jgi:hypothetical protein
VKSDKSFSQYSRPLIASLLIGGGLLQLAAPVLAEGTPAGTTISNTATASYEDPSDPTKPLNTVSNTVEVKVAEVAGITVTADTFSITKAGSNTAPGAEVGDTVNFVYNVTNVGNDTTKFHIPGTAATTGPGSVTAVQYESAPGVWTTIPAGGSFESAPFAPGGILKVRVVVSVLAGATANTPLTATLGKTVTPGQQNVVRNADGGDVYTVDNADNAPGEVNGAPENGVREASATQTVVIGATPQAFATIAKVHGTGTVNSMSYTLGLKVADQIDVPASSNKIAADLAAIPITLDNVPANKVLVSDAVPAGTSAGTLTAPSGWKAVYTLDDTTTLANAAKWVNIANNTAVPVGAKRVGFIADGPIAKGTTVSGMIVNVSYGSALATSGGNLANIAQVFGSTATPGTGVADPTKPVYDESGDNKPNNYNDDGTAPTPGPTTNPLNITDGVANPNDPSVDGGNNNTGTGPAGEPNVFQVVPASQAGMLNGTANKPDAVGPTGNNDDFTNLSTAVPATTWVRDTTVGSPTFGQTLPQPLDPASVAFANTFKSATAGPVSLMPTTPATPLPDGTKVTITYGASAKTFIYDTALGKFVNTDATTGARTTTPATPLVTPSIAANTPTNYGVEVDLPAGTAQLKGYGVPITAFVDTNTNGVIDATEPQNMTIDRVYTGYLKLDKQAQILDVDGVTVIQPYSASSVANPYPKNVAPNQMIQYKIVYTNISDVAPAGSGSVALNAQNIVVTEDGVQTTTNPNSWYTGLGSAAVVTTHRPNSAVDTNGGTITFGGKSNGDTDISIYKNTVVGPLAPQTNGSFSFIRVVK